MNISKAPFFALKSLTTLITLLACGLSTSAKGYEMPVGIPDAPIDFLQEAPERPNDWSAEVPGY
jgi:hypothetical protein